MRAKEEHSDTDAGAGGPRVGERQRGRLRVTPFDDVDRLRSSHGRRGGSEYAASHERLKGALYVEPAGVRDWPPETASRGTLPAHLRAADSAHLPLGARLGIGWIVIVLCGGMLSFCSGDTGDPTGPREDAVEVSR